MAAKAGLRPGDIITRLDGKRIFNLNRLWGVMRSHPMGTTLPIEVKRKEGDDWKTVRLEIWLGDPRRVPPPGEEEEEY